MQLGMDLSCGISNPHGRILLSTNWRYSSPNPLPFKEIEYLCLSPMDYVPIDFLFTLDHMELMVYGPDQQGLPTPRLGNLPLFHALRLLVVENTNASFLAGHTFHKLERCRVVTQCKSDEIPGHGLFTEMPVCTRLNINDLILLSTFKLPHIQELAVEFRNLKCSTIWEKQIAVNANLSGLKLLHMRSQHFHGKLDQILRPCPLLETLIISSRLNADCLRSLLPLCADETSGLQQSSSEGRLPAILCPMLQRLQIEGAYSSEMPWLIPVLKDIAILRAVIGSPLKSFTLSAPSWMGASLS